MTAGSGAAGSVDDQSFTEFWAPLWSRPARVSELKAFLAEGRTSVNGKTAKDGLEFAVAVGTLGSQRGIPEYQRFALLQREPRNPKKATPLGRVHVRENPRASLVSELDARGWLSHARTTVRDSNLPPSLCKFERDLDEALFRLASDDSKKSVQEALIALGALALEIGRRPKLRGKKDGLPPPPHLSKAWAEAANDGTPEFLLAEALASLDATWTGSEGQTFRLPFRRHLAALAANRFSDEWEDTTEAKAFAVWSGRDLLRDMAAVLERRLIEAQRHGGDDAEQLPLRGRRSAPLAAVAAFLARRTDDDRIAALISGLAWVQPRGGAPSNPLRNDAIPFAYAALKPLFAPDGVGRDKKGKKLVDPLPLVRLLRAGRAAEAVAQAQQQARGAGLPAPFERLSPAPPSDPLRLAAALLFPDRAESVRLPSRPCLSQPAHR
ncbi:MAG: type I-U CRISPR-associated protein Csx17 [Rhodospirillales bacterium]|nr:type I-U CRISPR-associated protein Csx17 [Rhodospirillales bacterium]